MPARIEKSFHVKQPVETVWGLLKDPRAVANFVPGAKITEEVDERTFKGAISVKVGPSVTDFKGELHVVELDEENHQIKLEGKGQDVRGKSSASMRMTGKVNASGDGTDVVTVSEVNVVGILAQFGGRIIQDVSDVMFREFVKRFQARIEQPDGADDPAANKPVSAVRVVSSAVGHSVRQLFKGSGESGEKS